MDVLTVSVTIIELQIEVGRQSLFLYVTKKEKNINYNKYKVPLFNQHFLRITCVRCLPSTFHSSDVNVFTLLGELGQFVENCKSTRLQSISS